MRRVSGRVFSRRKCTIFTGAPAAANTRKRCSAVALMFEDGISSSVADEIGRRPGQGRGWETTPLRSVRHAGTALRPLDR